MTEEEEEAQGDKLQQVRAERQGDEAVAIGVSQDYDSVGEISRGAYWVIRSHDGGKTWGRPLYTGLRIQAPYVVRPASNVPLRTVRINRSPSAFDLPLKTASHGSLIVGGGRQD